MGSLAPADLKFRGQTLETEVFIETGTFRGDTLAALVGHSAFQEFHSIELVEEMHVHAVERLLPHPRVHLYVGSSPRLLGTVIDPKRSTTFWLDAHYQGYDREEIGLGAGECPLMAELGVIIAQPWEPLPIILIDDVRMLKPGEREVDPTLHKLPFDFDQWPTVGQVCELLAPRWTVEEYNDRLYCLPGGSA